MRRVTTSLAQISSPFDTFVCSSCRRRQLPSPPRIASRNRSYAVAAAPAQQIIEDSTSQLTPSLTADSPQPQYNIRAGILLSRPPLLTAPLTPFESSFFFYQRRLNERLVLPFPQYFYYKRGTPAYEEWKSRRRERGWAATRDVGNYNAYSKESWNDEVLIGDEEANPENVVRKLAEEEGREKLPSPEEIKDTSKPLHGLRRITEADRKNDTKSLERALTRTLYLLVQRQKPGQKKGEGIWQFPSGVLEGSEALREAAERTLQASCGPNMNTWFVANHPVGHSIFSKEQPKEEKKDSKASAQDEQPSSLGEKTFFLKSRILAGKADIGSNTMDVLDYQWVAKDEIEKLVHPSYWRQVKNMLAER